MSLEVNIAQEEQQVKRVSLDGRLDTLTAPQLDRALETLQGPLSMLVFDMEGLSYISSAGLRSIFKATKAVQKSGGRVGLMNMQPQVRKVFDIVKALPDVPIFRDDTEMDAYLTQMQQKMLDGELD